MSAVALSSEGASTRADYERFAFQLLRRGRVPDVPLAHLDFRVLLFLLGQKPGDYAAHQQTIAVAVDSNVTSVRRALGRLRTSGLVLWELIPPHHRLPTGRFTRTNVCRYWVAIERLAGLLEAPTRPAIVVASTRSDPTASSGTDLRSEQVPPPTPSPEVEAICEKWDGLGLGAVDARGVRALQNRRAEGATTEQLEAAVAGAGVDDWLRRRAKVPFAVVFASLASLERFAHAGRKLLERPDPPTAVEHRDAPHHPCASLRVVLERPDTVSREGAAHGGSDTSSPRSIHSSDEPPTREELRAWLPSTPTPATPARPLTAAEFEQRRREQLARAEAWARGL